MCDRAISRFWILGLVLLFPGQFVFVQTGFAQPEITPVARILEIEGTATVWDPEFNEERPAAAFGTLYSNERLRVPENSVVTIVLRDAGQVERITAAGEYQVRPKGCVPRTGVEQLAMPPETKATIRRVSEGRRGIVAGAVVIARSMRTDEMMDDEETPWTDDTSFGDLVFGPIEPVYDSTVLEPNPRFSWPEKPGATKYTVQLLRGANPVWSGTTDKREIEYASSRPLGQDTQYNWKVTCELEGRVAVILESQFRTASEEQRRTVAELEQMTKGTDRVSMVVAAMWLRQNGFLQKAIEINERLAKLKPEVPVYEQLMELYWEANDEAKANAVQERMKKL